MAKADVVGVGTMGGGDGGMLLPEWIKVGGPVICGDTSYTSW